MRVLNEVEQNSEWLHPGDIPVFSNHEDVLKDLENFDLNTFFDNNEVENSEEFKNVSNEINEILSDLELSEVKSLGYYVLLILYTIIIFIGISGNVTVLMAIFCKRSMRTPHNFFIAALAVSGMLQWDIDIFQTLMNST